MCRPRRTAQTTTRMATSACRAVTAPDHNEGANAPAQPTAPSPKVQIVSIQPEFRLLFQAAQAPLMMMASAALTVTRMARKVSAVMMPPAPQYAGAEGLAR